MSRLLLLVLTAAALVSAEDAAESVDQLFRKAVQLEEYGDRVNAYKQYTAALAREPGRPDIRFRRGACIVKMLQERPGDIGILGLPDSALNDLGHALRRNASNGNALYLRGMLQLMVRDEPGPAVRDFSAAIKLNERFADAYRGRALAFQELNQLDSALADFDRAIALDPNDHLAYAQRGALHADDGEYGKAVQDFTKVLLIVSAPYSKEAERTRGNAHVLRGEAYLAQGMYDKALKDHKRARAELDDDGARQIAHAWSEHADALMRKGKADEAVECYTHALTFDPDLMLGYAGRARAQCRTGQYTAALEDCNRVLKQNPESYYEYVLRARIHHGMHKRPETIADLQTAIKLGRQIGEPTDSLSAALGRLKAGK